jgi:hypothetical protein
MVPAPRADAVVDDWDVGGMTVEELKDGPSERVLAAQGNVLVASAEDRARERAAKQAAHVVGHAKYLQEYPKQPYTVGKTATVLRLQREKDARRHQIEKKKADYAALPREEKKRVLEMRGYGAHCVSFYLS